MNRENQDLELSDVDWPDDELSELSQTEPEEETNEELVELIEFFDYSTIDAEEKKVIDEMFGGHECVKCCSMECNKIIPKDLAVKHRQFFSEMNKAEQDAIILAQLQQTRRVKNFEEIYSRLCRKGYLNTKADMLQRFDVQYYFCSIPICRQMYFFLHDIGIYRYKSLCRHFDENGIVARIHKSSNKTPARDNILPPELIEKVVLFIKTYADNYGLPLPGRLPNFKNFDVIKLPSNETKTSIYRKYCDVIAAEDSPRIIARSTFVTIWKKYCPYVAIMKPADDLCGTCRSNQLEIIRSANSSANVKQKHLDKAAEHLQHAQKQREYYNSWRKMAEKQGTYQDDGKENTFSVLSFDFAESLSYPFNAQQVGPIYFKTPRKCGWFGIHDESNHNQTHFLIDEADSVKKGANTVISLLEHFLNATDPKDTLVLFADNCVGQNKNNAVLQYFLWRVLTGKNKKILYNFLVAGHTKFSPDRGFGMAKKKYATSTIDCLDDLADCIQSSSPKGLQKVVISYNPRTCEHVVEWNDWVSYLQDLFSNLPGLTQYHHFIFSSDGSVRTKKYADSEAELSYLEKPNWTLDKRFMIKGIIPDGLPLERQWYLYDHVRSFIIDQAKKDYVAPKPQKRKMKHSAKKDRKGEAEREKDDDTGRKISATRKTRNLKSKSTEPIAGPSKF